MKSGEKAEFFERFEWLIAEMKGICSEDVKGMFVGSEEKSMFA